MRHQIEETDLSVMDYSLAAWLQTFPKRTQQDYERSLSLPMVDAIVSAVERAAEMGRRIKRIRHVTLDDEFLAWLDHTGKPNTPAARIEYADSLCDEDVHRLWAKGHRRWTLTDYVHFVVIQGENIPYANFPIPFTLVSELRSLYSRHFGLKEQDMYIHPELQCPDFYQVIYQDYFLDEANERFTGRLPSRHQSAELCPRPHHANVAARVIPIAVRHKQSPIYGVKELLDRAAAMDVPFSDSELSHWAAKTNGRFTAFTSISPTICLIPGTDVEAAADLIISQMQGHAGDIGVNFRVE